MQEQGYKYPKIGDIVIHAGNGHGGPNIVRRWLGPDLYGVATLAFIGKSLLARGGQYKRLYELQFADEEEEFVVNGK